MTLPNRQVIGLLAIELGISLTSFVTGCVVRDAVKEGRNSGLGTSVIAMGAGGATSAATWAVGNGILSLALRPKIEVMSQAYDAFKGLTGGGDD